MAAMFRTVFSLAVFLLIATHVLAVDILWTDSTTGQILRGTAGSGTAQVLFDASDYPLSPTHVAPFGIASDDNFVYWSDSTTGQILRGSLDGQGPATLLFDKNDYPGPSTVVGPAGVSVDTNFVYWADSATGTILRGNKNGTGTATPLYAAANYPGSPSDIYPWDVTVSGGQLYWSDADTSQILKGAVDGSSAAQALFTSADERVNLGLAIDGGQIYWGDTENEGLAGSILRGSITGTGLPQILYEPADYPGSGTSAVPSGISAQGGQLYWVDSFTKQVLTASTSGSGTVSVLFDISDYPGSPTNIGPTFLTAISASYNADFDDDGDIDGRDFLKWQRGQSPAPLSSTDLALWKGQYGSAALSANVQGVPEPLTLTSLLLTTLAAVSMMRRR
jgi:hypothetical protein